MYLKKILYFYNKLGVKLNLEADFGEGFSPEIKGCAVD